MVYVRGDVWMISVRARRVIAWPCLPQCNHMAGVQTAGRVPVLPAPGNLLCAALLWPAEADPVYGWCAWSGSGLHGQAELLMAVVTVAV